MRFSYFLLALVVWTTVSFHDLFAVEKKVRMEAPFRYQKGKDGKIKLMSASYRQRRPSWGKRLSFALSSGLQTHREGLKSKGIPLQLDFAMNRNFKYFSIGPEVGYFKSTILNACNNEINFSGITAGGGLYLDGLFKAPYVVPIVSVGAIFPTIKVQTADVSCVVTGEKDLEANQYAMYYRVGFLLGLNWLDEVLAGKALSDYGLQNSFLYLAVRQIPSTSDVETADIGTKVYFEYGLQLEF